MASQKVLNEKKAIVNEITDKIKTSESVILFQYQGLKVSDLSALRNKLREVNAEVKVYKNTLLKRAVDDLNLSLEGFLEGPNAILFGKDLLEPIKVIADFAKENEKLDIRVGIISGDVADINTIREYASIPSREGLLTMFASGLIEHLRNFAIGLNLYTEQKEEN